MRSSVGALWQGIQCALSSRSRDQAPSTDPISKIGSQKFSEILQQSTPRSRSWSLCRKSRVQRTPPTLRPGEGLALKTSTQARSGKRVQGFSESPERPGPSQSLRKFLVRSPSPNSARLPLKRCICWGMEKKRIRVLPT